MVKIPAMCDQKRQKASMYGVFYRNFTDGIREA